MTIKKGSSYGEPGRPLPPDGVAVSSDAEARAVLEAARRDGRPFPVLGLKGGDLCRTLGGPAKLDIEFPVDVGEVLVDGRLHLFVAHLVARSRLWSPYALAAMNAQWRDQWNLGPRGHPNDGLLDVYEARLRPSDLPKVRARLHAGAHLPHPRIKERRVEAVQVDLPRRLPVELDGEVVARGARALSIRVRPDALTVVV